MHITYRGYCFISLWSFCHQKIRGNKSNICESMLIGIQIIFFSGGIGSCFKNNYDDPSSIYII